MIVVKEFYRIVTHVLFEHRAIFREWSYAAIGGRKIVLLGAMVIFEEK
jgi:hypothetical protein